MAENIDRSYKSDDHWFNDYTSRFNNETTQGQSVEQAHNTARSFADNRRLQTGTPLFNNTLKKLQYINNWDSGAALRVTANLIHAETQVDLTQDYLATFKKKTGLEILAGVEARMYVIVPDGNYFINPVPGKEHKNLTYGRWGALQLLQKKYLIINSKAVWYFEWIKMIIPI